MKTEKYWGNIVAASVSTHTGKVDYYSSLEDAIYAYWRFIPDLKYGHLGYASHRYTGSPYYMYYTPPCFGGDVIIFKDELGLVIPVWKIKEVYHSLPPYQPVIRHKYRRWFWYFYDHDRDFRNGPVPGIRCWRGGRSCTNVSTKQEQTENEFLQYDEDCVDLQITPRGKRKHLPTSWDDYPKRRRGNSWKEQRKSQYKPK